MYAAKAVSDELSGTPDAKVACWYGEKEGHMKVDDGISGAVWV